MNVIQQADKPPYYHNGKRTAKVSIKGKNYAKYTTFFFLNISNIFFMKKKNKTIVM